MKSCVFALAICVAAAVPGGSFGSTASSPRIAVSVAITGKGTVASSPTGIACPRKCKTSLARGTVVRLKATAASGWKFSKWLGSCSTRSGSVCVVRVTGPKTLNAVFLATPPPSPPPPPTTTTTTAPPASPVTAGSYKGSTQDGNFVYFTMTANRQMMDWRTNDLTEQCNAGYYIPGSVSLQGSGILIQIDDLGHFDYVADGTVTLSSGSPDKYHFEIAGNVSGTNVSGTVVTNEGFDYNGIHLICASPVTSWTATLQP